MKSSLPELTRGPRTSLKLFAVLLVLSSTVALLSDYVFSPWEFDPQHTKDAPLSMVPRIGVAR